MGTAGVLTVAACVGYLIGAIPTGYLIGRFLLGTDVRTQGSGKTGATNVRRMLGWKGFFLVYGLDILKGAGAVLLAGALVGGPETWVRAVAGLAAVVGHSWPVYLGFKGGRGVGPGTGAMLVMAPEVILVCAAVSWPLVFVSRYVSLGSVAGAVLVPTLMLGAVVFFDRPWPYFYYSVLGAAIIMLKHKDNIGRLLAGTERRI